MALSGLLPQVLTDDDALLTAHQSSNLVALCVQQNEIGIALLDLSAGLFKVQQQEFQLEQLGIELSRLMPSEILVDENIVDPISLNTLKTARLLCDTPSKCRL